MTLGQELAASLKQINTRVSDLDDDDLNLKDPKTLLMFGSKIKTALQDVWKDHATDVFDIGYVVHIFMGKCRSEFLCSAHRKKFPASIA